MVTIKQVQDIVREAAKLMTSKFDVEQKEGFANIVTSSDIAVQNFLCDKLSALLPGSGFVCEEDDVMNISHDYIWIIDPIDGTANYSRNIDQCAICVGLKHNDDMVMGVVFLPRTNEMFYAEKGKGAYLNNEQIHVSQRPFANGIMCTALPVYHKEYAKICSDIISDAFMQINDIRRFGACAPELCYLAMGRCDLYFEYLLSPWDFAAASLILTEAGGCITDIYGNELTCLSAAGALAANSIQNHEALLSIVKKHLNK